MNKTHRLLLIFILLSILLTVSWLKRDTLRYYVRKVIVEFRKPQQGINGSSDYRKGAYDFNDLHKLHITAAHKKGIKPLQYDNMVKQMAQKGKIVHLKNDPLYRLKKMSYSHPYAIPEAKTLLVDLATLFQSNLTKKGIPVHYFQVSSVLRTEESLKRLRKNNNNSSKNSAHLYATTFDITYKDFLDAKGHKASNAQVRQILSESLSELRNQKRCFVKTEVNQLCFHITVR